MINKLWTQKVSTTENTNDAEISLPVFISSSLQASPCITLCIYSKLYPKLTKKKLCKPKVQHQYERY